MNIGQKKHALDNVTKEEIKSKVHADLVRRIERDRQLRAMRGESPTTEGQEDNHEVQNKRD